MRRFIPKWFAVAALVTLVWASGSLAEADQLVNFSSAAAAFPAGKSIRDGASLPKSQAAIDGYLTKPKGKGPFPAVVLLHSCLGFPSDRAAIGSMLAGWGYVALFVDDFGPRGLSDTCAVDFPQGLSDAFGGLAYLASLPYVDRTRIAAVGFSQGADTALKVAALGTASAFKAVAALYPPCGNRPDAQLQLPTLILVGAADTVTPASYCQQLAGNQSAAAEVKLVVYPGAGHVFDDPAFAGGKQVLGMWLQFNRAAAVKAHAELRRFLAAKLEQ